MSSSTVAEEEEDEKPDLKALNKKPADEVEAKPKRKDRRKPKDEDLK